MISPQISIIIPVYQVEEYLAYCIDSVLAQTFLDWELLLIDDGSPDRCGQICDAYARKDGRIRVFHVENGGVGSARNIGIRQAQGEWLTFIDSDDWIAPDFIASLMEPAMDDPYLDFIHGGCQNYQDSVGYSINQQYDYYKGEDVCKLLNLFRGLVVSKLFKKSIIDKADLYFDEQMKIAEDYVFTLDYLAYVRRYCFIESTGYFYRYRPMSATKSGKRREAKEQLTGLAHHITSLQYYQWRKGVSDHQALKRWTAISTIAFGIIREQGFFRMEKKAAHQLVDSIRRSHLLKYQPALSKRLYMCMFMIFRLFV